MLCQAVRRSPGGAACSFLLFIYYRYSKVGKLLSVYVCGSISHRLACVLYRHAA